MLLEIVALGRFVRHVTKRRERWMVDQASSLERTALLPLASCGQDIAATGFLTSYAYDPLDNLTSVNH